MTVPFTDGMAKAGGTVDLVASKEERNKNFCSEKLSLRSYDLSTWSCCAGIWISGRGKRKIVIGDKNLKIMRA